MLQVKKLTVLSALGKTPQDQGLVQPKLRKKCVMLALRQTL